MVFVVSVRTGAFVSQIALDQKRFLVQKIVNVDGICVSRALTFAMNIDTLAQMVNAFLQQRKKFLLITHAMLITVTQIIQVTNALTVVVMAFATRLKAVTGALKIVTVKIWTRILSVMIGIIALKRPIAPM